MSQSLTPILSPIFKDSLPDAETAILELTLADDRGGKKALDINTKGTNLPIMALDTPGMINTVMLEQQRDSGWRNKIFRNIWEQVLADELPDDDIVEIGMDDELRKLKLPRDKDPRELLGDIAAIEVQYKYNMTETKKVVVVS